MTEENGNASSTPAPEGAAPETETTQQPAVGDTIKREPEAGDPDSIPTQAPPDGCEYVFNPSTKLWSVRAIRTDAQIAESIAKARHERSGDEGELPAASETAGQAVAEQIVVPTVLPDAMQNDEEIQGSLREVASLVGERGYTVPQVQRLLDLGAGIALETGAPGDGQHPPLDDESACLAYLRTRWGSKFDVNLAASQKAAKALGPKFITFLNRAGAGNRADVNEMLSALGRGDLSLSKPAAEAEITKLRALPEYRDRLHKDHRFTVTRLQILSEVVHRGEDNGQAFEEQVSKVLSGQMKAVARGETLTPAPAAKVNAGAEAQISTIRAELGKAKYGTAEYSALRVKLNEAYRAAYPGEHQG